MNILSLGNFFNPSWDGSQPDEEHIASSLESLGHTVHRLQREDATHETFVDFHPDFILIAQWSGFDADLISRLKRRYDCPVIYWAFDYQEWGQEWHERLVAEVDLYLSKRIADSKYPNWQWLSQDFAPQFLDKHPIEVDKDIDVLFTGSYLPWATERNAIIEAVGKKYNLVIHSVNVWPQGNMGPVMDDALPALYAQARIVLSIDHTLEAGYWSDRNAQAMACGAFVMFKYVPLSKSIFKDHIVYFKDVEDCLWRLEQLLERPQEDLDIVAEGGYQYAHNYMMVKDRVKDLLTIVDDYL